MSELNGPLGSDELQDDTDALIRISDLMHRLDISSYVDPSIGLVETAAYHEAILNPDLDDQDKVEVGKQFARDVYLIGCIWILSIVGETDQSVDGQRTEKIKVIAEASTLITDTQLYEKWKVLINEAVPGPTVSNEEIDRLLPEFIKKLNQKKISTESLLGIAALETGLDDIEVYSLICELNKIIVSDASRDPIDANVRLIILSDKYDIGYAVVASVYNALVSRREK